MGSKKVLLDTDIGTDIDDAVCLAYLLANPECELMGITTVSGQAVRLNNLALLYSSQGRYGKAEHLYERALAILKKTLGSEHPDVAAVLKGHADLSTVRSGNQAKRSL